MLSKQGLPLSTIGVDRLEWYLKKGLAREILDYHDKSYPRVIQLNFTNNSNGATLDRDIEVVENKCVVCGSTDHLTLHHILPIRIKRYYPASYKEHTRHQCVLLCEEHHNIADEITKTNIDDPGENYMRLVGKLVSKFKLALIELKHLYIWYWILKNGGIRGLNAKYEQLFREKLKPKFMPKNW